ncbi:MAG: toxin-activating lysine-acyltransferase [Afipia sp.]|nr:toxin-activating lysine-acyltransferase [Afipia sp.]
MSGQKKSSRGGKLLNKGQAAVKRNEKTDDPAQNPQSSGIRENAQQVFGEDALAQAIAEFGVSSPKATTSKNGSSKEHNVRQRGEENAVPPPKTVSQVLGEIVWLMTQSPRHKSIALGDLEWLLMPAILLKQFRIFYKGEQPVGVAIWALVDDLVAKRIDANDKRLTAVEWKSGTNMRVIDIVAPFGGEHEILKQLERPNF